jgi:hypothetical protein
MLKHQVFAVVLALAALNGIFSPLTLVVAVNNGFWAPLWLPSDPSMLLYLSSMIVATTTLLAAGVPAALYERVSPGAKSTNTPLWIWAAVTVVLSIPALVRLMLLSGLFN